MPSPVSGSTTRYATVVTCSSCSVALNRRSRPPSTAAGRGSLSASARSALRTRPIPAAAVRPLPITSPSATASRWSASRKASYQSPPISMFLAGRYLATNTRPGTLGSWSGSRLRCSVSAVLCSRSYSPARSTASWHCPASASRKTRSSSVIFLGRPKENRSAPSGAPAASSGRPTQDRSSEAATRSGSISSSPSNCLRRSSGSSTSTGRRVAIALVITLGDSSVSSPPAESGALRRSSLTTRSRALSGSSSATAERSAPIAVRPTSVMTSTTCSTVSASASIEVACCSRAVRSAAAHLLGLALAGHVGAGTDPLDDLAVPLDRHRAHVVVPVGAALGADPVPVVENLAGADALTPVALDPLPVLRVDRLQPAGAEEFLHRLAGDPAPLRRVLLHRAVGTRHPDDLRAALHQRPVALLAAPDLLLGLRGRVPGHVEQDEPDAGGLAVGAAHREPVGAAGHDRLGRGRGAR